MAGEEFSLAKVFRDAEKHRVIADIISRHLSNKDDIRRQAFNSLNLSGSRSILDLGCGFGFFTEALKNRVHAKAKIIGVDKYPEYEWFYFQSCEKAGVKADFLSKGIKVIEQMDDHSFDLIICSYALYFFPETIHHISRILKDDGVFITITHAIPHMQEFIAYVRSILKKSGLILTIDIPYETLISRFSDKNGTEMLQAYFSKIKMMKYKANLTFGKGDHEDLVNYFDFKQSFFIPEVVDPNNELHDIVIAGIKEDLETRQGLKITKNDVIFVCSGPNYKFKEKY